MSDSRLPQVQGSFGAAVIRVVIEQLRTLPEVWQKIPEEQQQGLIEIAREEVEKTVREGIAAVMAFGFPHTEVGVESITVKSAGKIVLSLSDQAALHDLVDAVGRKCVLVLVDPEMFTAGMGAFKADADQPALPLGEPVDEDEEATA